MYTVLFVAVLSFDTLSHEIHCKQEYKKNSSRVLGLCTKAGTILKKH